MGETQSSGVQTSDAVTNAEANFKLLCLPEALERGKLDRDIHRRLGQRDGTGDFSCHTQGRKETWW